MPLRNINLAHDMIWPRWKRQLVYRLIALYLCGIIVLLIPLTHRAVQRTADSIRLYSQSKAIEQNFAQKRNASPGLLAHAQTLRDRIERNSEQIASVNEALPGALRSPTPVLVLLANQPNGSPLHSFSFMQQTPSDPVELQFSLATPVYEDPEKSVSAQFIEQLKNDPALLHQFSEINQLRVRRIMLAGQPVFITQYTASNKD